MANLKKQTINIKFLYKKISTVILSSRENAYKFVNTELLSQYWDVGRLIVEEEQHGKKNAKYGSFLITQLAVKLSKSFGKGYTEANLRYIRQFYLLFPIRHAVRDELSWTHYRLLIRIMDEKARNFYMAQTIHNRWSTRQLDHEISSLLYERMSFNKKKRKAIPVSQNIIDEVFEVKDFIKDPYVLPFLGLKETIYSESQLQDALITHIQEFLIELGRGFAFVAKEKRLTTDSQNFYIDLVFYNYILKCFVLIDLKVNKLTHADIGQMDFYVRYYEKELRGKGDNPTIGIILCADKDEAMVKYTLLEDHKYIFASKYKFYFPSEDEFRKEVKKNRGLIEIQQRLDMEDKERKFERRGPEIPD